MCTAFAEGKAHLKPEVAKFVGNKVFFEKPAKGNIARVDDSPVELDSVILCTGFKQWWPFLPDGLESHDHLDRLRHVFHPELPNVGFCGFARPVGFGAIPPLSEIQARWIALVASGKAVLPPRKEFLARVRQAKSDFLSVRKTPNQTLVFYPYFLSEVAHEMGVAPAMFPIFLRDPKLWYNLMWKPFTPHQFRLEGHGSCPELARDMIVNKITMPTTRQGPLARPNKILLGFFAIFFGMLSKVPILGEAFKPCI
jgi:dimethylaniline monooxygenase (N-oxide forming)